MNMAAVKALNMAAVEAPSMKLGYNNTVRIISINLNNVCMKIKNDKFLMIFKKKQKKQKKQTF
jgi:hypothetical protein